MSDPTNTIEGVQVIPLRRIPDERGTIFHMLRADDPHFIEFGEIYFASVYEGVVKAWHLHHLMTLNYACIHGRVKLACYDDRPDSPTRGNLMEVFLGPDNYSLVVIPPGIWNGHKGMGPGPSIIANCATHPHDPSAVRATRPVRQRDPVRLGCPPPLRASGASPSATAPTGRCSSFTPRSCTRTRSGVASCRSRRRSPRTGSASRSSSSPTEPRPSERTSRPACASWRSSVTRSHSTPTSTRKELPHRAEGRRPERRQRRRLLRARRRHLAGDGRRAARVHGRRLAAAGCRVGDPARPRVRVRLPPARHPQPGSKPFNPHHRWLTEAESYSRDGDPLLLLPTTCSLGQWFKWGRRTVLAGPPDYQMVYLHDYDLLASRTRLMLDGVSEASAQPDGHRRARAGE